MGSTSYNHLEYKQNIDICFELKLGNLSLSDDDCHKLHVKFEYGFMIRWKHYHYIRYMKKYEV